MTGHNAPHQNPGLHLPALAPVLHNFPCDQPLVSHPISRGGREPAARCADGIIGVKEAQEGRRRLNGSKLFADPRYPIPFALKPETNRVHNLDTKAVSKTPRNAAIS